MLCEGCFFKFCSFNVGNNLVKFILVFILLLFKIGLGMYFIMKFGLVFNLLICILLLG